ncbi:MAG: circadian clock protein KaiA [Iphinoe sp. HA4291-MV1]|nr:circadian clock protein KaiA [Iphinoe sp. HA4291-MV1]
MQYLLRSLPQNINKILSFNYSYAVKCHKLKSHQFFQQMTRAEEQALLQQLKSDYRQILINYFTTTDKTLKEKIDKFINAVFYANIPVPQIIEIHMELIDEFSKQLKLEGRSDEALLDYRLTLIDILAHLCELYRCSIYK